ncbi:TPA: DUF551 domain-containing protein [Klebsiella aerogenes]|nr:DUF551 domain-containing protein [Klebsiella aerogenes]EIV5430704.1 DUF551 domain-containing protein [Klebsiella aerogenes]EKU4979930.1 DUF551 domain-containing protein [Klebsiella aerogenes]ELA0241949.1 DUF551 domain-containing protein [Klebsiella aerogenes]ELA0935420.1 DUF551 domain-containing protein [Klebsiella aerogenes]
MALAAMDSEPVAYTEKHEISNMHATGLYLRAWPADRARNAVEGYTIPLYPHAQPAPVVPEDVLDALQKVARIRLELNDFDGDRRGIADCLWEAEEALLEVVKQRAAMLQAEPVTTANKLGNSPVIPDTWIPVSERLPEEGGRYWCYVEEQNSLGKSHYQWNCSWNGEIWGGAMMYGRVTHWMPLPAAPQEVKP